MIIGMVELDRDFHLRPTTIGHLDSVILRMAVDDQYDHQHRCQTHGTWKVHYGAQIARDTPIPTNFVKLVEHYTINRQDLFVERLCYKSKRGVIPYKIKQLYATTSQFYNGIYNVGLVKNIESIHHLLGSPTSLATPISVFVNGILPDIRSGLSNEHKETIRSAYHRCQPVMDAIATDDKSWVSSLYRLCDYDRDRTSANDWCIDDYVLSHLRPNMSTYDEITARSFVGGITYRQLETAARYKLPYVDLGQPRTIQIDPGKTICNPPSAQEIAECLNNIGYTDICLEYILSNCGVADTISDVRYDRYRRDLHVESENQRIRELIDVCLSAAIDILADKGYKAPLLYTDIRFRLIKTFGEEALIEIFDDATKDHVLTIHLDLALTSLCTVGAVSYTI